MAKKQRTKGRRGTKPIKAKVAAGRKLKQPALPGTRVRNVRLDRICEAIGDERDTINKAKREEQGLTQGALQTMQKATITVYRHAGIELARIPGAEKLRVRRTKEQGDADESDLESADVEATSGDDAVNEAEEVPF